MSSVAIMSAIETRLNAVLNPVTVPPSPSRVKVYPAPPKTINDERIVYVQHHPGDDVVRTMGGIVKREHHVTIRLMVRAMNDDDQKIEQLFLDLADLIADAFFAYRHLGGVAGVTNAVLAAHDQYDYITFRNVDYRQREWTLTVSEDRGYTFAASGP